MLYLRAQTELGELLGISKHKTRATMSLEVVLRPENIILRSRTNFLVKIETIFHQNPSNLDRNECPE